MATPTKSVVFEGDRLVALMQSLCSLRDQVKIMNADPCSQEELEESAKILTAWLSEHFQAHMKIEPIALDKWGFATWGEMQNLLSELSSKVVSIQATLGPMPKPKGRFRLEGKKQQTPDVSVLSPSVTELHNSLEAFVTLSEIKCRMNHPGLSPIRPALEDAVQARRGAYILYHAIQASNKRVYLNINLFSWNPASAIKDHVPRVESEEHRRICYHLIFKDTDRDDMCFQDVNHGDDVSNNAAVRTCEDAISLLEPLERKRNELHCIQRGPFDRRTYFHVTNSRGHTSAGMPLSDYLKECPQDMEEKGFKHSKLLLAFQLSECALNLMGTPFLAQFSARDIRVHTLIATPLFILALRKFSAEDLYQQYAPSLIESEQLLRLGMVMIEIALGPLERYQRAAWPRNPYRDAAELLPHVRKEMGDNYYKICAFCVEEWISKDDYKRADKWDGAEENGWNVWLRDFLRVYDSFVVEGLRKLLSAKTH